MNEWPIVHELAWYKYDGQSKGTEELYSFSGTTPTDYVFAEGLLIAKVVSNGSPYYYHPDALGSTRLVTDSGNNVQAVFSDSYQPYGQDNGAPGSETFEYQRWTHAEVKDHRKADMFEM